MINEHVMEYFVPFVIKLASKDWFTARISAASLLSIAYARVSESTKKDFRNLFIRLCGDDTPMVGSF